MNKKKEPAIFPRYDHTISNDIVNGNELLVLRTQSSKGDKFEKTYKPFNKKFDKDGVQKATMSFGAEAKTYFDSLRDNLMKVLVAETTYKFEDELMKHIDEGWKIIGGMTYSKEGYAILMIKNKK